MTYIDRCKSCADAMHHEGWPRLHSPVERDAASQYAMLYRNEIVWRLVWGVDKGSPCPDLTGTAYETSWVMLRGHLEKSRNGKAG